MIILQRQFNHEPVVLLYFSANQMGACQSTDASKINDSAVAKKIGTSQINIIMINDSSTPRPPLNKSMPRLYGHFLCPYAERVRLALSARNVKFERCEINLKDKPQQKCFVNFLREWHQEIEGGTIPLLELPVGEILKDSKVLMEYVDQFMKKALAQPEQYQARGPHL